MKTVSLLFILACLSACPCFGQVVSNVDKIIISDSLRLRGYSASDISNDTTVAMRRQRALMTEWAVKNYVGLHGGGGGTVSRADTASQLNSLTVRGSATLASTAAYGLSLFIGKTNFEYPNSYVPGASPHGLSELIVSPSIGRAAFGSWGNTIFSNQPNDKSNSFNTLIGNLSADGTDAAIGNNNTIVKAGNGANWSWFGYNNQYIGYGNAFAGSNNVLIGGGVLTQAGAPASFDSNGDPVNTRNIDNQINIGNYIFKDSVGHFGVNRWPVAKSVAVDLASNKTDGGVLVPKLTTTQQNALLLSSDVAGMVVYNSDSTSFVYYDGIAWRNLSPTIRYTPSSSSDPVGKKGYIAYDGSYMYVKTDSGWMRSSLSAF